MVIKYYTPIFDSFIVNSEKILKKYGFVLASKYRKDVVLALEGKPKTPKEISMETNCGLTHVSRSLQELTKNEITKCATPERIKGRIYQLTDVGKEILKLLKK